MGLRLADAEYGVLCVSKERDTRNDKHVEKLPPATNVQTSLEMPSPSGLREWPFRPELFNIKQGR